MDRPIYAALTPGAIAVARGRRWKVECVLGGEAFLATDEETGEAERLRISDLEGLADETAADAGGPAAGAMDGPAGEAAQARYLAIAPLVDEPTRSRRDVEVAAATAGVSAATIYAWIRAYERSGHVSSLLPDKRGRRTGTTMLSPAAEAIVKAAIKGVYLTTQRKLPVEVLRQVEDDAGDAGITAPHANTVYRRIRALDPYQVALARGEKRTIRRLTPSGGKTHQTDRPMQVVIIDTTNRNVIGLSEEDLLPLGRPYITLAICAHTRLVLALVTSPERPNAAMAGALMSQLILPKGPVLAALELEGDWPVWGKPETVVMDNAGEFDSISLKQALAANGIRYQFRQPGEPNHGAQIERLMLVEALEVRNLPGATFANPKERGDNRPEREAVLTMDALERQAFDFFVNRYNREPHSALGGMTPLDKWKECVFGGPGSKGVGLPKIPADPARIRIDFMELFTTTIQRTGARIRGIDYWDAVLQPYILSKEPGSTRSRRFTFKRDPRCISPVWFLDPKRDAYLPIPFADRTMPPMSVWELAEAKKQLKRERKPVNQLAVREQRRRTAAMIETATQEKLERSKSLRKAKARAKATARAAQQTPADAPNLRSRPVPGPTPPPADDLYSKPAALPDLIDFDP